jgi:hypothetical protein
MSAGALRCGWELYDPGVCDTLYAEVYPPDTLFSGPGHLVRVPIYVTHDVPDPSVDSLYAFMIPLKFRHTNPSAHCTLLEEYNQILLHPSPNTDRSIFRHLDGVTNWMMALSEQEQGFEWSLIFLDLDFLFNHFWFALSVNEDVDQSFGEGSRVLLATMTFRVSDLTTICVDTSTYYPKDHLRFYVQPGAPSYVPRQNLPHCFSLRYPSIGDVNADGQVDPGDLVFLINYLFRNGPPPPSLEVGDVNCDEAVTAGDVVYLIQYLFRSGPEPSC